jgi:Skp family chaperone for outer membrane proteins
MRVLKVFSLLLFINCFSYSLKAQHTLPLAEDSTRITIQQLPAAYLSTISSKADKYYSSITSKTEKTLERLSKWEAKIKTLLEKASPETAQRLFGNNQMTFAALLQKYKEGKAAADNYKGGYDEYRDKLTTSLHYLNDKKAKLDKNIIQPVQSAQAKITALNKQLANTEAVKQFIKERKKQLVEQTLQYIW